MFVQVKKMRAQYRKVQSPIKMYSDSKLADQLIERLAQPV